MQSLRALIRSQAIATTAITNKVSDRIYPSEIALVENPVFPCLNFSMDSGGGSDFDAPKIHNQAVAVWAWSTISYDEAAEVYETFFNAFQRTRFKNDDLFALFAEATAPIENFDELTLAYNIFTRWSVTLIDRT